MASQQELEQEIAALAHELRRIRDGLERNPSHALEAEARRLEDNIALCRRELELIRESLRPARE